MRLSILLAHPRQRGGNSSEGDHAGTTAKGLRCDVLAAKIGSSLSTDIDFVLCLAALGAQYEHSTRMARHHGDHSGSSIAWVVLNNPCITPDSAIDPAKKSLEDTGPMGSVRRIIQS
jgi:hypothetical protein